MIDQGLAAARLFFAVALNAVGLAALLAAAWLMPQVLELFVKLAAPAG